MIYLPLVFTILISLICWQLMLIYPPCSFILFDLQKVNSTPLTVWFTSKDFSVLKFIAIAPQCPCCQGYYRTILPLQTQQRTLLSIPLFSLKERDFTADMISYRVLMIRTLIYKENPHNVAICTKEKSNIVQKLFRFLKPCKHLPVCTFLQEIQN